MDAAPAALRQRPTNGPNAHKMTKQYRAYLAYNGHLLIDQRICEEAACRRATAIARQFLLVLSVAAAVVASPIATKSHDTYSTVDYELRVII